VVIREEYYGTTIEKESMLKLHSLLFDFDFDFD